MSLVVDSKSDETQSAEKLEIKSQLIDAIETKFNILMRSKIQEIIRNDLKQIVQSCIENVVPPIYQKTMSDNLFDFIPELRLNSPQMIYLSKTPPEIYLFARNRKERDLKQLLLSLVSLMIERGVNQKLLHRVVGFQQSFDTIDVAECIKEIDRDHHDDSFNDIFSRIRSILSEYNLPESPLSSISFSTTKPSQRVEYVYRDGGFFPCEEI